MDAHEGESDDWGYDSDDSTNTEVELDDEELDDEELFHRLFLDLDDYRASQRADVLACLTRKSLLIFLEHLLARGNAKPSYVSYPERAEDPDTVVETKVCPARWIELSGRQLNDIERLFRRHGVLVDNCELERFAVAHSRMLVRL